MNTDRLRLFLEIVGVGTLSEAAKRMHVTQPAASRSLRVLEAELGVELFVRQGRGLVLSESGRALVPRAREALEAIDRVVVGARQVAERELFDLRLGAIDSVATYLVPQALVPVRQAFPELAIKLRAGRTVDLLERLEDGTLDLAIVAWSGAPPHAEAWRVGRYDMQFYGDRRRFPGLAAVEREEELSRFPLVQIEASMGQPTLIDEQAPSWATTKSLATVKALVLGGFGVGAMLEFMLAGPEREQLVRARIEHDPECALWLLEGRAWRAQRGHVSVREVLATSLIDAAK